MHTYLYAPTEGDNGAASVHPSQMGKVPDNEPCTPPVVLTDRPRDGDGHCWDGRPCDHPSHGDYRPGCGIIHLFR
jgi:hypothetical protein